MLPTVARCRREAPVVLTSLQWICLAFGALLMGISKTAIGGLGARAVALFTYVFPSSKQASGLVLPLLIFADFVAVFSYRQHAQWRYLAKLLPWTAVGVVLGYFTLSHISDSAARWSIGLIILGLAVLSVWWRYRPAGADAAAPIHWSIAIGVGIVAGFITLM